MRTLEESMETSCHDVESGKTTEKPNTKKQPSQSTQRSENKPLMDLRSILKKHEKKAEKPMQTYDNFNGDFAGSMSAIPFLKTKQQEKKKQKKKKKKSPNTKKESKDEKQNNMKKLEPIVAGINDDEITTNQSDSVEQGADKGKPNDKEEQNTVSYLGADGKEKKLEITIIKDYDEEQLKMWKQMSDTDDFNYFDEPSRTGRRKLRPSNLERGHNRPDEWLNPDMKEQDKMTYKIKMEQANTEQRQWCFIV